MHYDSIKNDHGLPHNPFEALAAARPIGWISTVDTGAMCPIARMGYLDYAAVTPETVFALNRPKVAKDGTVDNPGLDAWDGVYR